MQYFPISLERWLKSQSNLDVGSTDPMHQCCFEGWTLKVFGQPHCEPLRSNWPPEALIASQGAPQASEVWLILPNPMPTEGSAEISHATPSAESRQILDRILNTKNAPELGYFSNPIPICTVPRIDNDPKPWIAWQLKGSQVGPDINSNWELLASLLDRLGLPPKFICDDWTRQLQTWKLMDQESELEKQLPSLAHRLLVSKSGLLLPLSGLQFTSVAPMQKPISIASATTIPKTTTKPYAKKKHSTLKAWIGVALAMPILGWIALANRPSPGMPQRASNPDKKQVIALQLSEVTSPTHTPSQEIPTDPLPVVDTIGEPELIRTELEGTQAPATNFESDPKSIESLVANSLDLNIRLASTQEPLPEPLQQPLEEKAQELPTPKRIVVSQAIQKMEFRVERGFAAKKAVGIFTLNLDPGLEDKLRITGAMSQELTGESTGSWRIGMDDLEAELLLSIQSKPGPKWLVNYSVQIPSESGGPPILLGPKDPAVVLSRLAQYNVWLQQTVDQWKFTASGNSKPGQPSPIQMARLYSAKQKDTERAMKRWRQIEQLSTIVFDSLRVQVELKTE